MKKYGVNMSIDVIGSSVAYHVSRIFKTPDSVPYQKGRVWTHNMVRMV